MSDRLFVLLAILGVLAGGCRSLTMAEATTPSGTRSPTMATSPSPYVMPTPPPAPTAVCAGAPPHRLILQERGRVLADDPRPVNIRQAPGVENQVIEQMPIRSLFYVLEGPVCDDNYSWFRVRYDDIEGWIAEGDLTSYFVEPYLAG